MAQTLTKQEALAQVEDKLIQIRVLMEECEALADEHQLNFNLDCGPSGFAYNHRYGWDDVDGNWMGSNC